MRILFTLIHTTWQCRVRKRKQSICHSLNVKTAEQTQIAGQLFFSFYIIILPFTLTYVLKERHLQKWNNTYCPNSRKMCHLDRVAFWNETEMVVQKK